MPEIYRWYIKTTEDEILDGPFDTSSKADKAKVKHFKTYKYDPVTTKEKFEKSRRRRAKATRDFDS